ncbi:hypothetical protein QAD02_005839 [Eretmocerus hayati]|uniref:Uncharacterized protein n=1 Tax=Eretmocerus hayati TaxID=131215 RepID=A0ACC2NWJ1_9HYME|nr:hypothetical protein QAD02_005839 [Eretmocerus hayati]
MFSVNKGRLCGPLRLFAILAILSTIYSSEVLLAPVQQSDDPDLLTIVGSSDLIQQEIDKSSGGKSDSVTRQRLPRTIVGDLICAFNKTYVTGICRYGAQKIYSKKTYSKAM